MTTPDDLRLLTRRQVADLLAISERDVDRLRVSGDLDAVKVGSRIRITWASVATYRASLPAA